MDSRLELYRGVGDAELLRAHGLFVAEGRLVVRRVLEDPRYRVHSVLLNDAAKRQLVDVLAGLPADVPVVVAPTDAFVEATGFNIHRGCLALVHRPTPPAVAALLRGPGPLLVLEGVANADNVGGAFRNAAAFGASGVVIGPGTCDPLYRKAIRTSMGAALRVPFAPAPNWPGALAAVRTAGFVVAALTPREPSQPLDRFAEDVRGRRVAFLLGGEGPGISPEAEALADVRVRIPIAADLDSLNVAVASAIALYALSVR